MSRISIVTDSTSYLPPDLVAQYGITVAPQVLIWGDQSFRDGVDISPQEFYNRLKSAKIMPSTSQVSPATMQSIFQPLVERGSSVLGIFISTKLSGTIQSAQQAKELMGSAGDRVTIVDSLSTSMSLGLITLAAARAAEQGASLEECVSVSEQARERSGVFFAVDTLEFLHRGGRIGGATRFIGSALNLKPILALRDGRVEGIERIRTRHKAHDRLLELLVERVQGKQGIRIAALHANAEADARALLERAAKPLGPVEKILSEVSPVVGTHAGPGTVGLAFLYEE
jgi:DegV family protein with EDD domain